tara:strand:- start:294 stop:1073 length:780 start_codon:yes stop_codon:yes gene_type:complete
MYIHNLDPIIFEFGVISLRWYSLSYIVGIILGWWYGNKIILKLNNKNAINLKKNDFDDFINIIIISIILGGRLGYVVFYNFNFYINNPLEILMIWKGGMSFHGGLIGVILGSIIFSRSKKVEVFNLLDVVACVAPIGLCLGRISNFINGELVGKQSDLPWAIIFPKIDDSSRHPSQLYEAFFEGIILFLILNYVINKFDYKKGFCSVLFLIFYGIFRFILEFYREPDHHIGYIADIISTGSLLSLIMLLSGILVYLKIK